MTGPSDPPVDPSRGTSRRAGHETDRTSRRAGHETDRDFVDKDVDAVEGVEREGEYVDKDVDASLPHATREGDYTDKDVPDDDTDTPPGSYVRTDGPG